MRTGPGSLLGLAVFQVAVAAPTSILAASLAALKSLVYDALSTAGRVSTPTAVAAVLLDDLSQLW